MSEQINEVRLAGRVSAAATERELPSGDVVASFRLSVPRSSERGGSDTIDCAAWRASQRRTVGTWQVGDEVEVSGELRRRFWRGAAGVASRYEVEVLKARRTARATA
jgi:single-strand DNA-binding protein